VPRQLAGAPPAYLLTRCLPLLLLQYCLLQVFNAISDELRAKDNAEFAKSGNRK
jgi:hypothetical protein